MTLTSDELRCISFTSPATQHGGDREGVDDVVGLPWDDGAIVERASPTMKLRHFFIRILHAAHC
jgi:hypothetical protein